MAASQPMPHITELTRRCPLAEVHVDEVDPAILPSVGRAHGITEGEGDTEVAGQQVARAARDQPERDVGVGELRRDRHQGAVASPGENRGGAVLHRLPRLPRAGILRRCLEPCGLGFSEGRDNRVELASGTPSIAHPVGVHDNGEAHGNAP